MDFVYLFSILLPLATVAQFGDYKPPAPRCAPFTCPAGQKPIRRKSYKTWSYGCAESGANFLNMANLDPSNPLGGLNQNQPNFNKCCLEHDACLQTCGMTSVACHEAYEKCSTKVCKGNKNCGFQAQMAIMMNSPYSPDYTKKDDSDKSDPLCTSYDRLQQESCECVSEDAWQDTFQKRLKTFYKLYNKDKLNEDGSIKDMEQVKSKWGGKEAEMFLELTKKYKDKAIEKRIKPKPPPYTPPEKGTTADPDASDAEPAEVEADTEPAKEDPETSSAFRTDLKALQEKKAKAIEEEDYDTAANAVDEIKALKEREVERLHAEKKQAIEDENYMKAKSIKKAIDALQPAQEL